MKFMKIERPDGIAFEFRLSNKEVQQLVDLDPRILDSQRFYGRSVSEALERIERINEYLADIRYEEST